MAQNNPTNCTASHSTASNIPVNCTFHSQDAVNYSVGFQVALICVGLFLLSCPVFYLIYRYHRRTLLLKATWDFDLLAMGRSGPGLCSAHSTNSNASSGIGLVGRRDGDVSVSTAESLYSQTTESGSESRHMTPFFVDGSQLAREESAFQQKPPTSSQRSALRSGRQPPRLPAGAHHASGLSRHSSRSSSGSRRHTASQPRLYKACPAPLSTQHNINAGRSNRYAETAIAEPALQAPPPSYSRRTSPRRARLLTLVAVREDDENLNDFEMVTNSARTNSVASYGTSVCSMYSQ